MVSTSCRSRAIRRPSLPRWGSRSSEKLERWTSAPQSAWGPTTYDAQRNQFVAEELLRRLTESYRIAAGRKVLIVGVTSHDIYERGNSAEGQATVVGAAGGGYVVVSTSLFGADPENRKVRLREVLLAEIERAGLKRS